MPQDTASTHSQLNQLPVPCLDGDTNYETYKNEVEMWQVVTDIPKAKQGVWLALAISSKHPLSLKDKVLSSGLGKAKLGCDTGIENLLEYLDKIFLKGNFSEKLKIHTKMKT